MTTANAIKKLSKHAEVTNSGACYAGRIGRYLVGFIANRENAVCIGIKNTADSYAEWIYYPSLASAIASAEASVARAEAVR
jgi:hypothetical protein